MEDVNIQQPPEEPEAPIDETGLETDEAAEETQGTATPDDQPGEPEASAEPTKDADEPSDPETVPYTRFKTIYGQMKQYERELAAYKEGKGKEPERFDKPEPQESEFETYSDYVKSLTAWTTEQKMHKIQQTTQQATQQQRQQQLDAEWDEQIAVAAAKDPEWNNKVFIPMQLKPFISGSKNVADFAYHFGENPQEAQKILSLGDSVTIAREIGKLDAKFENKQPEQRATTKAPEPTKEIDGGADGVPKRLKDMSMEDYAAYRKRKLGYA